MQSSKSKITLKILKVNYLIVFLWMCVFYVASKFVRIKIKIKTKRKIINIGNVKIILFWINPSYG